MSLYQEVVSITQEYLGPAANRFVDRLINFHLNKKPEELTAKDIAKLSEWIKVSLGMLTEDKAIIDDCQKRIMQLSAQRGKRQPA
jgi:hypothetical protein